MTSQEKNQRLTQVGSGTAGGAVMRQFWQPVALVEEFDPAIYPAMKDRPLKAVRALGQDFVLFKQPSGEFSLLDKHCAHRGADLAFARLETDGDQVGIRCPFHGWKYDSSGQCVETPAEPTGSTLCQRIKQPSYPTTVRSGVVFAWLAKDSLGAPPPFPALDCYKAPASHSFAFKGLWQCNWLQAFEVGIDPAHPSFLHRFLHDVDLDDMGNNAAGKQFRSAAAGEVAGERWPMSRVMRELCQPKIDVVPTDYGMQLTATRTIDDSKDSNDAQAHVRTTHAVFPHTFVIPLSETMTITQIHLPVDDTHTYWYSIFTSTGEPLDKAAMREQRARFTNFPDYSPTSGRHNDWGFNAAEQQSRTYLGMGEDDINVHDQWAVEGMGRVQDRTKENLGTSDIAIAQYRRWLLNAMDQLETSPTSQLSEALAQGMLAVAPQTFDGFQ